MPRKKKPQTLPELYAAKEETENELRKAKQKEKILQNQISKLTRNARTHRLCTRAGMLESFLPNPELMTDDEVMIVLKIAFHQPAMKPVLENEYSGLRVPPIRNGIPTKRRMIPTSFLHAIRRNVLSVRK